MINKILKNKFSAFLLSLGVAFALWWYVVTTVSQETDFTLYNVPVVLEGESILVNERNLMITSMSADDIDLTLYGSRSNLAKVNSSNVVLKADLTHIYEPGEQILLIPNIIFPGDVAANALTPVNRNPDSIYITVEARRHKEVPVEIQWEGAPPEGYMSDRENRVLDHSTITVIGPASVADQIDKAVIAVDLTDQKESISQDYKFTLCDQEGNPVDAELITTNVTQVHLDVRIRRVKEVTLTVDVVYGGGATQKNTTVSIEPEVIRLSGSEAMLAEVGDTISLGKIDLGSIENSQQLNLPISIPDGITNLSNITEAVVSVQFQGLNSKEVVVANLVAKNVPKGLDADIIEKKLVVVLRGPVNELTRISGSDITIVADLSNATVGTSTFRATVQIPEEFKTIGAVGSYSVTANIWEHVEETAAEADAAEN